MAPDPQNTLGHLLDLLDDDSPVVRTAVITELSKFGSSLREELRRLPNAISDEQRQQINNLLENVRRRNLKKSWFNLFQIQDPLERLEEVFVRIEEFQYGVHDHQDLATLINLLADEYQSYHPEPDALSLAKFLFETKHITGDQQNYYNPFNSNLLHLIIARRGIPLTISCLLMLVGKRLELPIRGCGLPRHFLSLIEHNNQMRLLDCFDGVHFVDTDEDIIQLSRDDSLTLEAAYALEVDTDQIIQRLLSNLVVSYQKNDEIDNSFLILELLKETKARLQRGDMFEPIKPPMFQVGQIVEHKRYGYRGIIVDYDLACMASESWYQANQTQPNRNQPWYHILVHNTDQVTYVAETSLQLELSQKEIRHPLLHYFFDRQDDGTYQRNSEPWPQ